VTFDPKGSAAGSVEIILGPETGADERHIEHTIHNVERIAPIIGLTGLEDGVGFEDKDGGKTLLLFEQLLELSESTSDTHDTAPAPA
jgi:hypothetical protein